MLAALIVIGVSLIALTICILRAEERSPEQDHEDEHLRWRGGWRV